MSLTVTNQAQLLYNIYSLTSSSTYEENAIDSSAYSEEAYNASDLTSALEVLTEADSVNFYSIGNLSSYVQTAYALSQIDTDNFTASSILNLLTGDTEDIYELLGTGSALTEEELENLTSSSSTSYSTYSSYLSETGSIVDVLG